MRLLYKIGNGLDIAHHMKTYSFEFRLQEGRSKKFFPGYEKLVEKQRFYSSGDARKYVDNTLKVMESFSGEKI